MMGVPFYGATNIFMDNKLVVKSALDPKAKLKKFFFQLPIINQANHLQWE